MAGCSCFSLNFSTENSAWGSPLPLPVLFEGLRTQTKGQEEWAKLKIWELPSPPAWARPQRAAQRSVFRPCRQEAPALSPGTVDRASGLRPEDREASRGPGTGFAPGTEGGGGCHWTTGRWKGFLPEPSQGDKGVAVS